MKSLLQMAALSGVLIAQSHAATNHPTLALEDGRRVMSAAIDYARSHNAPGAAVAIVDEGGSIVLLQRMDNTFPAAPNISVGKARTAAGFLKPTRDLEKIVNGGRVTMTALPEVTTFTPLQGGVPLLIGTTVVGAVGVSGSASAQQDDDIAQAAADALAATPTGKSGPGSYIPANDVRHAFASGDSLLSTPEYKVTASRRDKPGQVEVHLRDTDIFYVVEGSGNLVTGGTVVDANNTSPEEVRGTRLEGGTETHLKKGDVVVIARGVPHWFRSIETPLQYFTVKSSQQE